MPYKIEKRGDKFAVINKETGKVKSSKFTNVHDAVAYMRALYRAESGAKMTGKKGKPFKIRKKRWLSSSTGKTKV